MSPGSNGTGIIRQEDNNQFYGQCHTGNEHIHADTPEEIREPEILCRDILEEKQVLKPKCPEKRNLFDNNRRLKWQCRSRFYVNSGFCIEDMHRYARLVFEERLCSFLRLHARRQALCASGVTTCGGKSGA